MKLPNAERAVVDPVKLRDYCLDSRHPRGKHKARVFETALGMTRADAGELKRLILASVPGTDCEVGAPDIYGERFLCDAEIRFRGRSATIRTAWIIRRSEDFPRLTTCFILRKFDA